MKNMNNTPNIRDITPIIILAVENIGIVYWDEIPLMIEAIPKNNKLSPTITEAISELNIGLIMKIRPTITNKIPMIFLKSKLSPNNYFILKII